MDSEIFVTDLDKNLTIKKPRAADSNDTLLLKKDWLSFDNFTLEATKNYSLLIIFDDLKIYIEIKDFFTPNNESKQLRSL